MDTRIESHPYLNSELSHASPSLCQVGKQLDHAPGQQAGNSSSYPQLDTKQSSADLVTDHANDCEQLTEQALDEDLNYSTERQSQDSHTHAPNRNCSDGRTMPVDHEVIDLTFSQPSVDDAAKPPAVSSARHLAPVASDDSETEFDQSFVASTPQGRVARRNRQYLCSKVLSSDSEAGNVDEHAAERQRRQIHKPVAGACQEVEDMPLSGNDDEMVDDGENEDYVDFPPLATFLHE